MSTSKAMIKAVDLNVQKDIDADPKSIHQIGFIGQ